MELVTRCLLSVSIRVLLFPVLNSDQVWTLMNTFTVLNVAETELLSISSASLDFKSYYVKVPKYHVK